MAQIIESGLSDHAVMPLYASILLPTIRAAPSYFRETVHAVRRAAAARLTCLARQDGHDRHRRDVGPRDQAAAQAQRVVVSCQVVPLHKPMPFVRNAWHCRIASSVVQKRR